MTQTASTETRTYYVLGDEEGTRPSAKYYTDYDECERAADGEERSLGDRPFIHEITVTLAKRS